MRMKTGKKSLLICLVLLVLYTGIPMGFATDGRTLVSSEAEANDYTEKSINGIRIDNSYYNNIENGYTLSWNAVDTNAIYSVERRQSKNVSWETVYNGRATKAVVAPKDTPLNVRFQTIPNGNEDIALTTIPINPTTIPTQSSTDPTKPIDPTTPTTPTNPTNPTQPTEPSIPLATDPVTGLKATKSGDSVVLTWNAADGATGYEVCSYDSVNKTYKTLQTTASNTATLTGLKKQQPATLAVRALQTANGTTAYSAYSDMVAVTVYYADYYAAVFKKGEYTVKMKLVDVEDLGMEAMTVAAKNGNINMQTRIKESGMDLEAEMRYIKKSNRLYVNAMGMWIDGNTLLGEDSEILSQMNIFGSLDLDDLSSIDLSTETIDSTLYVVETVHGHSSDTKIYYLGDMLKRIVVVGDTNTTIEIFSFSPKALDGLFVEPDPSVVVDIGGMMNAPNLKTKTDASSLSDLFSQLLNCERNTFKAPKQQTQTKNKNARQKQVQSTCRTLIQWDYITGVKEYVARVDSLPYYSDWFSVYRTGLIQFLPCDSIIKVRVCAIGDIYFRITAREMGTSKILAQTETLLETCIAYEDGQYRTPSHIHDFALHEIVNATCTQSGYTTYICKYDSTHKTTETIPAFGHLDANHDGYCDRAGCGAQLYYSEAPTSQNEPTEVVDAEATQLDEDVQTNANVCKYCGKVHNGFFQKIVGFFHRILAFFGLKKK